MQTTIFVASIILGFVVASIYVNLKDYLKTKHTKPKSTEELIKKAWDDYHKEKHYNT